MSHSSSSGSNKTNNSDLSIEREIPLDAKNILQIGNDHYDLQSKYKNLNPKANYIAKNIIGKRTL